MFYEELNSGNIDLKDYDYLYPKAIEDHEAYLKSNSGNHVDIAKSYSELIEFYRFLDNDAKIIDLSFKYYNFLKTYDRVALKENGIQLILTIVNYHNEKGDFKQSLLLLNENDWILKRKNKFRCFNGTLIYSYAVGTMYFSTYRGLNKNDEALKYGFKYLMNNDHFSPKIVEVLTTKYNKEELDLAFKQLENNFFIGEQNMDSYFKFLDFSIPTNAISGVYYSEDVQKPVFQQLQGIRFYKYLSEYLEN